MSEQNQIEKILTVSRQSILDIEHIGWVPVFEDKVKVDKRTQEQCLNKRLLVYVSLVKAVPNGAGGYDKSVLSYLRGKQGGQDGLIDKRSIGFGGHPNEFSSKGQTLTYHLALEAQREVKEELGIDLSVHLLHAMIENCLRSRQWIMLEDTTPEVHYLGIPITYHLSNYELELLADAKAEQGHVEDLRWDKVSDIKSDIENKKYVAELWSQHVLNTL